MPIDGVPRSFIPISAFRVAHGLPAQFGVAHFEPKAFAGLASLDKAGASLGQLRARVLEAIPAELALMRVPALFDDLRALFRRELTAINDNIKLKPAELDFAVAGFGDANQAFFYALVRNQATLPTWNTTNTQAIYHQWVAESARLSQTVHDYVHDSATWQVQIVNTVYGRIGLQVTHSAEEVSYVLDGVYACPARAYM
ncbi:MAG: hypothetical protein AAFR67_13580, partial [Chloroflexota bacterium]